MKSLVSAFLIGILFGLGITISGMINPAKVLNFFDLAGNWDPSLAFVMGGGLVTALIGYRLVFGRLKTPLFGMEFSARAAGGDRPAADRRRGGIWRRLGHSRLLPGRRDTRARTAAQRNAGVRRGGDRGHRARPRGKDQAAGPCPRMAVAETAAGWHESDPSRCGNEELEVHHGIP